MAEWTAISKQRVQEIYDFVSKYKEICDAHTVDFLVENHWESLIPDEWKRNLLPQPDNLQLQDEVKPPTFLHPEQMDHSKLKEFLCSAKQLKFPLDEVETADIGTYNASSIGRFGMTEKKAHEVKKMAAQVKSIAAPLGLQQIIDIGSGKGYLSECLSFVHGFKVYGIDSSPTNTEGALDRSRKVEKYFSAQRDKTQDHLSVVKNVVKSKNELSEPAMLPDQTTMQSHTHSPVPERLMSESPVLTVASQGEHQCTFSPTDIHSGSNSPPQMDKDVPIPLGQPGFFKPLTHFIDPSDNVLSVVGVGDHTHPSALVGLHTCGDLACVGLRQFVENKMLKALCIVGCCYHHITEEGPNPGFPMSDYLKSKGAYLGPRIRMLSCQSEGRFSAVTSGSALQSVFFRAVLQVVFKDEMKIIETKEEASSLCVGRVKKYSGFVDYSRKAMKNLKIPRDKQPNDETLERYHQHFLPRVAELQRFLQVRAVLAPVIEFLITLDRFLYLAEKKEVGKVWIVQLFSPALSPRCLALCAYKT